MVAWGLLPVVKNRAWQSVQGWLAAWRRWLNWTVPVEGVWRATSLTLWQPVHLATLKARVPLWQAPQDFPFSMSAIVAWLRLPFPVWWQAAQLNASPVVRFFFKWVSWLKVTAPALSVR
jgi:hypothetical protein